ncbi:MAG: hypothetical protein IJA35_04810 [Clostridia bacterium]|nr:hypothetical protein [Clostridia bacterium]
METRYMTLSGHGKKIGLRMEKTDTAVSFIISPREMVESISEVMAFTANGIIRIKAEGGEFSCKPFSGLLAAVAVLSGDNGAVKLLIGRVATSRLSIERIRYDVMKLLDPKPKAGLRQNAQQTPSREGQRSNVSAQPKGSSAQDTQNKRQSESKDNEASLPTQKQEEKVPSAALNEILSRANELFRPSSIAPSQQANTTSQAAPPVHVNDSASAIEFAETRTYNPFPKSFPGSSWRRISKVGSSSYYLQGMIPRPGNTFVVRAVPADNGKRQRGKPLRGIDGIVYYVFRE